MAESTPKSDRQEKVAEMLRQLGVEGIVEQARAKVLRAQVEGKEPWEVGRSDVHELLTTSSY